jgi:starvation-inducible DNA-binding protein
VIEETKTMNSRVAERAKREPASTPSGFAPDAIAEISGTLSALLADLFSLYVKTKNFHWHVSGPHFRDYHLLLDEQAAQIFAATDAVAERGRTIGGRTLHSIGEIARTQRIPDNDQQHLPAHNMLAELCEDNAQLAVQLRIAHSLCDKYGDVASASLIEIWIDEAEGRVWFLHEVTHPGHEG